MPSVILEALSFGMFVITTDVGSVNSLKDNESIHILKNKNIFEEDWNKIYKKINQHLTKKSIMLKNPNFTEKLDILFDKF